MLHRAAKTFIDQSLIVRHRLFPIDTASVNMTSEASPSDKSTSPVELAYTRLSPSQEGTETVHPLQTIVFIHGSESCHLEFSRVAPFLQDTYEILLIDLPAHSGSRSIAFTFDNAIKGLVHLINNQIEEKQAHIVGLSLGGYIGLELAR